MNDEQVFELAEKCGLQDDFGYWNFKDEGLLDFVFLVHKAEREKVAKLMMDKGCATGHGDTIEDLLKELEGEVAEREREACAKVCDEQAEKDKFEGCYANACAEAIRARGET